MATGALRKAGKAHGFVEEHGGCGWAEEGSITPTPRRKSRHASCMVLSPTKKIQRHKYDVSVTYTCFCKNVWI